MPSQRLKVGLLLVPVFAAWTFGQALADDASVSREDYERLTHDIEALKAAVKARDEELDALKGALAGLDGQKSAQAPAGMRQDALSDEAAAHEPDVDSDFWSSTRFFLAGDADAGFSTPRHGISTFEAGFAPLLLFQVTDRILLEGALDLSLTNGPRGEDPHTEVGLAHAVLAYRICDYLTAGAGKFVVPFGAYHGFFDPSWINKLPDDPLPFGDGGLAPDADVGVFLQGAVPIGRARVNYTLHLTNGPVLETDDPGAAGSLGFDNFSDSNNNKAIGGRLGFLPFPELEVGYSFIAGRISPRDFKHVAAFLQAVDLTYARVIPRIKGKLTVWSAWVWSDVGKAVYDPTGALGFGPLTFDNDRNGGYVTVAYRPTVCGLEVLKDLEFVLRYDCLAAPRRAPGGGWERRWTPGLTYWLTPSAVVKAAYEFDRREDGGGVDAFLMQFGLGF